MAPNPFEKFAAEFALAKQMSMSRQGKVQKWKIQIDASELHLAARTASEDIYGDDAAYGALLKEDVCQKFASAATQGPMEFIGGMIYTDINSEDEDDERGFRIVANRTYRSSDAKSSSEFEQYEVEAAMTVTGQLQASGFLEHKFKQHEESSASEAHEEEGPDNDHADGDADGNAEDDVRRQRRKKKEGKDTWPHHLIKDLFQKEQV